MYLHKSIIFSYCEHKKAFDRFDNITTLISTKISPFILFEKTEDHDDLVIFHDFIVFSS